MSISFEMMTEPDTDAPKFPYTVTCTSTGGPATRSNFTKNGAQLGELELVDRVSAAYRRVAVGSGGEGVGDCYHCSASNDRPSAASDTLCLVGELVQYHDVPPPPILLDMMKMILFIYMQFVINIILALCISLCTMAHAQC